MDITALDLTNIGFIGLMTIGLVNVLSFFFKDMDSRIKFGASVIFAFALTFVPVDVANLILRNALIALKAAFGASGVYKLVTKAGGVSPPEANP